MDPAHDPRIFFAAERTLLAWIRTGLSLMAFGFVIARFRLFLLELTPFTGGAVAATGISQWLGASLVAFGAGVIIAAMLVHIRTIRRLKRGEPFTGTIGWLGVSTAGLLAVGGLLLAFYLFREHSR
jgi:putative membrane protein